ETRDARRDSTSVAGKKALEKLKAKGMQFNEIAPAEYARMQEATKPVIDKFSAEYDPAGVKLCPAELARIRSGAKEAAGNGAKGSAMAAIERLVDLYCRLLKVMIAA